MAELSLKAFVKYSVLRPILLATYLFAAQSGSSSSNGAVVPTYRTTAETVLVDVVVTDGKGKSVPNLTRDDFSLSEDGQLQQIKFFEEHGNQTNSGVNVSGVPATPASTPMLHRSTHTTHWMFCCLTR